MMASSMIGSASFATSTTFSPSSSSVPLKTATDYWVDPHALKEIYPLVASTVAFDGDLYSGLIPFENGPRRSGALMFWLFVPTTQVVEDTMVLWLNGGPGCSSLDAGAFMETAPFTIPQEPAGFLGSQYNDPLTANPYAWTKMTTMLYIEQPAGTGFSQGPDPESEDDVARDMHSFLQNFMTIFSSGSSTSKKNGHGTTSSSRSRSNDRHSRLNLQSYNFFIFGESYAGMYVPSIARRIYLENENIKQDMTSSDNSRDMDDSTSSNSNNNINSNNGIVIKLTGIALGNGWTEAETQGPAIVDYAWWHGMIESYTRSQLHELWIKCLATRDNSYQAWDEPLHPSAIPDECGLMEVDYCLIVLPIRKMLPHGIPTPSWIPKIPIRP
jgi:carboxypeptidase C (cathepsin A)